MAQTLEERLRSRLTSAVKQVAEEMSSQSVTGYLVKRLIVEGTFRNTFGPDGTVEGFQVQVKNRLGVATIIGATPLKVDGETFGVETVTIVKNNNVMNASELADTNPIAVGYGDELLIKIADDQGLESGKHKMDLGLKMVGLGLVEASFEDTLAGEGRKRIRKAAPAAEGASDFADVMKRTIETAAESLGQRTLADCANTVRGITLDLTDIGEKYSVKIGADGAAEFIAGAISGEKILTISITRAAFHNMAHGKLNPGIAYARGEIRLEGVPVLKLRGMDGVITAIFQGYRAASSGLEFEAAGGEAGGGILEEALGMTFMVFDEVLKALDKALGAFGVNYFYEKSLNRLEWVWEILDREVRKHLTFGRGADEEEAKERAETEETKPKPAAAPAKTLQDRLRERITSAIETAVSEVSRSAVSGYLVKRLIEQGSFRNYGKDGEVEGFEVKLKNKLGAATVTGFTGVKVDGVEYSLDAIQITKARQTFPASTVTMNRPLTVAYGDELLIRVAKPGGMTPGSHKVSLGVDMVGMGGMDVDYEEKLAG
ncbi:MAG: DUF6379 domain-containing protein [bacterium]